MPQSKSLLAALTLFALLAACTAGSSDDEDEAVGGSGGAGTGGSSSAGKGGKGSGGSSNGGSVAGDGGSGDSAGAAAGNGAAGDGAAGDGAGGEGPGACWVEDTLSWGRNGGNVIFTETSALAACMIFTHERTPSGEQVPSLTCTQGVAVACGEEGIGADEVLAALDHADVLAAIAEAPVLYGTDPRPYDGQVVQITIGGAVIEVGEGAIPEGVQTLADLLLELTEQELAATPCANVFE